MSLIPRTCILDNARLVFDCQGHVTIRVNPDAPGDEVAIKAAIKERVKWMADIMRNYDRAVGLQIWVDSVIDKTPKMIGSAASVHNRDQNKKLMLWVYTDVMLTHPDFEIN